MTKVALQTFPTLAWPEDKTQIPRRLFHVSPFSLHECLHYNDMQADHAIIMNSHIYYEADWGKNIPDEPVEIDFALIAFPDDKTDKLLNLLKNLIDVREFHFVDMENGQPRFRDVTVYPPLKHVEDMPPEILLSMAANVMRRHQT